MVVVVVVVVAVVVVCLVVVRNSPGACRPGHGRSPTLWLDYWLLILDVDSWLMSVIVLMYKRAHMRASLGTRRIPTTRVKGARAVPFLNDSKRQLSSRSTVAYVMHEARDTAHFVIFEIKSLQHHKRHINRIIRTRANLQWFIFVPNPRVESWALNETCG